MKVEEDSVDERGDRVDGASNQLHSLPWHISSPRKGYFA